ncbi:MAG TPA: protease HtpX [Spirochaetota bacterium]|nr:protease HtpX [Spirochaetota bacterium]HOD15726.1 protease HtpX [Spirochaetota bacterium]HPG50060.1 protease HtpX [Spirochaetota bacterium]HQL83504.1 protease HtpX [Spirochaetota bacterium]
MLKRIGLFLLTNILVVLMVSLILNILLPMLGIRLQGAWGIAVFSGVFGMTGAFISLSISRWMAKRAYGIQLIDGTAQDYRAREIYDMVAGLSKKAGLPAVPEVGVYNSPEPNAFATGPSKKKSLVAFSTGLLSSMDKNEVEAVAAHEVSHIANGDMVTMTLLTGVANAMVMFLARIIAQALNSFLSDDEDGGLGYFGYIMTVMALEMVLMLLASIPLAAFSRFREYRADAGSARITSPAAMASALERLKDAVKAPQRKDSFAMAKISSSRRVSLFSTHPSLEDRIARLRKM